jgi:uncharacterized protein YvpB
MRRAFALLAAGCPALAWAELVEWQPGAWAEQGAALRATAVLEPERPWDELVVSWNGPAPNRQTVTVTASAEVDGRWTKPFVMGVWAAPDSQARTSVGGQKDGDGDVLTDVLRLARPAGRVRLAIVVEGGPPCVSWVTASTSVRGEPMVKEEPNRDAWGRAVEVPRYRQMDFPDGDRICSPTSLSMVLAFWAAEAGKPAVASPVKETCRWVYDAGWSGFGNWSFNAAFAGSRPGMRACVARLSSLAELEDWIVHGWPVVCSVSNGLLRGRGYADGNDGHLVVLVGFTKEGDPVFNDPGRNETRQTYARSDFAAAWERSGRTVYLLYPSRLRPPPARHRNW